MKKILFFSLIAISGLVEASVTAKDEATCINGPLQGNSGFCGQFYNYNKATKQCWCLPKGQYGQVCDEPKYKKEDACPTVEKLTIPIAKREHARPAASAARPEPQKTCTSFDGEVPMDPSWVRYCKSHLYSYGAKPCSFGIAIQGENIDLVKHYLSDDAIDVNAEHLLVIYNIQKECSPTYYRAGESQITPLALAAVHPNAEVVKALLEAGAEVNATIRPNFFIPINATALDGALFFKGATTPGTKRHKAYADIVKALRMAGGKTYEELNRD